MEEKESFFKRIKRKFFVRTLVSYLVIVFIVSALIYFFSQGTMRNFYTERLKTHLSQVAHSMTTEVSDLYAAGDTTAMDRWIKELGQRIDIRVTVIKPDGTVLADSEKNPRKMENHRDRPEISRALRGDPQNSTRFSTTLGERMLYLALPLAKDGETQLVLRLSLFVKEIKGLVNEIRWKIIAIMMIIFLLALTMAWIFSRNISRPVQEIVAATRKFAEGDFDVSVFVKNKDELGEVADSFNSMVVQQKSLFRKLTQSRAQLQAIIATMKEGLLVLDRSGKIRLCNESLAEICEKKDPTGCAYWEVLRIPDFEDHVNDAFESGKSAYEEFELGEKHFLVTFNRMKDGENLVITFGDITGFKQLQKMKKDFVVNLTHELKTPLTAIKGFVETLEEVEDLDHPEYIEIIKRHSDRMNQIVSDMLTLSELEESRRDVLLEPVNLGELVENMLTIYRERIKEKNLVLDVDIENDLPAINGERFKLEQMFINLVDNSFKYTDEGGKISISINRERSPKKQDRVEIKISNDGQLIPAKSLPRLFERFYVVDKSRSRKLGGTGLGLSIVKHVALIHNGEVSVKSSKATGTVFTVYLPI